jgi:hypothetical protein
VQWLGELVRTLSQGGQGSPILQDLAQNRQGVQIPDREGLAQAMMGVPAGALGLPGDLESLARIFMDEQNTFLPTSEDMGGLMGANTESTGFQAGTFLSPDPLSKFAAAAGLAAPVAKKLTDAFKYADEYPPLNAPKKMIDKKTGREYLAKDVPAETKKFMAERLKHRRDIEAGNYDPFFDPAERYDAVGTYEQRPLTIEFAKPKKAETVEKWRAKIKTPEAKERLKEAYLAGVESGGHANWYQMGQLENEFIKEFGEEVGPQMFRERFSDAMAATTGGADPTGNLITAAYGNFMRQKGRPMSTLSRETPSPVGGRFLPGNLDMYNKAINEGEGLAGRPKRSNFSSNFEGNRDVSTIDEHMTQLISPGKNAPEGDSYFAYEELIKEVSEELGVSPRELQEVAWGGRKGMLKGGYEGKAMIEIVNEAIERTSRLTGVPPEEVVRRGLVRAEMPIYGLGAGTVGTAAIMDAMISNEQSEIQ